MLHNASSLDLSSIFLFWKKSRKIDHVTWIDTELIWNLIFPITFGNTTWIHIFIIAQKKSDAKFACFPICVAASFFPNFNNNIFNWPTLKVSQVCGHVHTLLESREVHRRLTADDHCSFQLVLAPSGALVNVVVNSLAECRYSQEVVVSGRGGALVWRDSPHLLLRRGTLDTELTCMFATSVCIWKAFFSGYEPYFWCVFRTFVCLLPHEIYMNLKNRI